MENIKTEGKKNIKTERQKDNENGCHLLVDKFNGLSPKFYPKYNQQHSFIHYQNKWLIAKSNQTRTKKLQKAIQ
jgi:hypothetical protein